MTSRTSPQPRGGAEAAPTRRSSVGPIDDYADAVLSVVESVPPGRVISYGAIAEVVGRSLGRGGPRLVARVMSHYGAAVPWHRVLRADGSLAAEVAVRQEELLATEGVFLRSGRVPKDFWHRID